MFSGVGFPFSVVGVPSNGHICRTLQPRSNNMFQHALLVHLWCVHVCVCVCVCVSDTCHMTCDPRHVHNLSYLSLVVYLNLWGWGSGAVRAEFIDINPTLTRIGVGNHIAQRTSPWSKHPPTLVGRGKILLRYRPRHGKEQVTHCRILEGFEYLRLMGWFDEQWTQVTDSVGVDFLELLGNLGGNAYSAFHFGPSICALLACYGRFVLAPRYMGNEAPTGLVHEGAAIDEAVDGGSVSSADGCPGSGGSESLCSIDSSEHDAM